MEIHAKIGLPVHPHGRGKHRSCNGQCSFSVGSSPRAWGTHPRIQESRIVGSVHPHGRGEHNVTPRQRCRSPGSSPRAWGTLLLTMETTDPERFIPTGVGNTMRPLRINSRIWVHPHGRGEHFKFVQMHPLIVGSSPRAWGTPLPTFGRGRLCRFIPTGVGNTIPPAFAKSAMPVHPHGRGEHPVKNLYRPPLAGSSPRAWGTRTRSNWQYLIDRFIPTGVGNTGI